MFVSSQSIVTIAVEQVDEADGREVSVVCKVYLPPLILVVMGLELSERTYLEIFLYLLGVKQKM